MERSVEVVNGDLAGVDYSFAVFRFGGGTPAGAPCAYLQGALHADELPGAVALHFLLPLLQAAEDAGRLRGRITLVPLANPVGRSQFLFGAQQGRFHLGSRTNFNRDFPLLERPDPALLPDAAAAPALDQRLKARLLGLALGHDIVLDLHCDDEGILYLYAPAPLWPAMADLASCLGAGAALVWAGEGDGAFEQAALEPYLGEPPEALARRVVATVELRGRADVDPALGAADARGLYRFLVGRGLIDDPAIEAPAPFAGVAEAIENVELLRAPRGGILLYHVRPGERVAAGQPVATLLGAPGEAAGTVELTAPQEGLVVTRRAAKTVRAGDDVIKILGSRPSRTARTGALEE